MRKISVSEAVSADSAESITGETGGIYMREREEGIREQGHGASLAPAAWKANEMRLWLKERMATHVRDAAEKLTDFEIQMVFAGICMRKAPFQYLFHAIPAITMQRFTCRSLLSGF